MAQGSKYGKVSTEKKAIPENEPVFLLRAQDELASAAVRYYAELRKAKDPDGAKQCALVADAMDKWPKHKMPD